MTKIKRLMIALAISLTLSACSALNPISAFTPKPSFDINTQLGKENTQNRSILDARKVEEVNLSGAQRTNLSKAAGIQSADWSAQAITVNQTNQSPIGFLYLSLLIAGWVLPDPVHCFRWVQSKLRRKKEDE